MNVAELFNFLENDYGLFFQYQNFSNCYNGGWFVETYSYFNNSGCFTIYLLDARGEWWCYYSPKFSTKIEDLCYKQIDIYSSEEKIWNKHKKLWIFNKPFFWWRKDKVLLAMADVIKNHVEKYRDLYEFKVDG